MPEKNQFSLVPVGFKITIIEGNTSFDWSPIEIQKGKVFSIPTKLGPRRGAIAPSCSDGPAI